MGVLAAGVGKMDADMGLEGSLVGREPGVAVYPEERAARGARVGDEMRAELAQARPKLLMNVSAGSRTASSYRCLFLANQSRSLWRLSWRRNWKRSGRKNASLGTSGTFNLSLCGSAARQSWSAVESNGRRADDTIICPWLFRDVNGR